MKATESNIKPFYDSSQDSNTVCTCVCEYHFLTLKAPRRQGRATCRPMCLLKTAE